MPLTYNGNILEKLKDKGITTYQLSHDNLLACGVVQKLRDRKPISWANIEKLCELLDCQPNDIIVFERSDK